MDADFEKHSTQVTITNLPDKCTAKALVHLLDTEAGYWILRLAIKEHTREAFRGQPPSRELVAFVDFASEDGAKEACGLSGEEALVLGGRTLQLRLGNTRRGGNVAGQKRPPLKLSRCSLHMGTLVTPQEMRVLWGASERGLDVEFDFARGLVRWYFQTSNTKLNSAPGGKGLIDVVLTSHMRDVRRVRELKNVLNGGRVSVPLLIQLWKPPRVSYRLPARETYEDPKLQSRFLWYDEDEDPYIRTTDPSPNQTMGRSLAYLVSAPPSHYKTCKNIVERLQHRPAAVPADISISDGPPPKVPKFGGAVPLGVLTPRNLDFSLAFLVNALVLDRTVSESALDEAFFGLLRRTAPEAAERALEKLRFRGGSKTPLADPPAELRALIDAELAESGSDASSESSSSDGLSESGSTPRTVLKLPNSEDETALTQNPLTLLNRPSPEQLAQWHLLEHRPSSSDETSTDEPASDSSSELEDDEDTAFAALLENLRMHPPRPLEQSPHQTLQPKAPETLQSNPPETRLTSPETRFSPEPLHPASRLLPVRQLATTPLRAHVAGPYMELGNRILRRRPELTDRFLRVFFTEEDLGHLGNAALRAPVPQFLSKDVRVKPTDTRLFERVSAVCKNGFVLAGRRYEFCGASTNQMRERSAWFFAPSSDVSVEAIWADMGDFTQFTNRSKLAARMALCFSTSTSTLKVPPDRVWWVPDVQRNGHIFSDGVGKISPAAAADVARMLGLSAVPSAYQIRYAGCKGMVVSDPTCTATLNLRDSMRKFDSTHQDLEIVGWSSFSPSYLNRQIITLLVALGIHDRVFEELQDAQLRRIRGMLTDHRKAIEVLEKSCSGDGHQALEMLRAGFRPKSEPYLRGMLQCIANSQLKDLRSKARIFVEKGGWCYGVMDETATLQEGEIFLQLQRPDESTPTLVTGLTIVAKNPCLHPGDVRVLSATDAPEVRARGLVNVVVFSQLGLRPEADKASGSDLDGDIYFVSHDARLVPPDGKSAAPMDYTAAQGKDSKKRVTVKDAVENFLNSIRTDPIGQISNAHVVHADLSPAGAWDEGCLRLAELAAVAVDFPKTGIPAIMPPELKPAKYPSYMEKKNGEETYESTKVLGRLYKKVARLADAQDDDDSNIAVEPLEPALPQPTFDVDAFDRSLLADGYEARLWQARKLKEAYEWELAKLMQRNGIRAEAEVVTGHVMHLADFQKRRKLSEVRDRVRFHYTDLKKDFRRRLEAAHQLPAHHLPGAFRERSADSDPPGCKLCNREERTSGGRLENVPRPCPQFRGLASACYYGCYASDGAKSGPHWWRGGRMYSFAWIAADVLGAIKGQHGEGSKEKGAATIY